MGSLWVYQIFFILFIGVIHYRFVLVLVRYNIYILHITVALTHPEWWSGKDTFLFCSFIKPTNHNCLEIWDDFKGKPKVEQIHSLHQAVLKIPIEAYGKSVHGTCTVLLHWKDSGLVEQKWFCTTLELPVSYMLCAKKKLIKSL